MNLPHFNIFKIFLGHLARKTWWIPHLCKYLHVLRGVQFKDRDSVFISSAVVIDNRFPEKVYIGSDVWLTHGVIILAHSYRSNYHAENLNLEEQVKAVKIGDGVFVGAGSIILPGAEIDTGVYIAAGSVVTGCFGKNLLIGGNPAKKIKVL